MIPYEHPEDRSAERCPECGNGYLDCHCRCPELLSEWEERVTPREPEPRGEV